MTIVMISSTSPSGREALATALGAKTGWPVLSREELVGQARDRGIKIGRLEVSVIKSPGRSEKLSRERELYLAFLTAHVCDKARQGDLIYHGRAGHLLLPGVGHRLRVGLTIPREARVRETAKSLNLSSDKAETYLDQLDEDIGKWIRYIHRVDGHDPKYFDLVLNLEHMGLSNAASILCEMAQLPDFRPTPAGTKLMDDLGLAARARLQLALDDRTAAADLRVHADQGVITVTYPPQQQEISREIPRVLSDVEGSREVLCTMAETNILWVQERFEPDSENFHQIMRLAQRWGAAVELLRLIPPGEPQDDAALPLENPAECAAPNSQAESYNGGVEDDDPIQTVEDGGLNRTQEELVRLGRSGGRHSVCGGYDKIIEVAKDNGNYSLVVIGDMFLSKGHLTQTRKIREMALAIRDRLKAPVITASELESRFMFGSKQAATLAGFLALVVIIYIAAFSYQAPLLDFLGGDFHRKWPWLTPVGVGIVAPIIAYLYGTVSELLLKLINID